MPDTNKLLTGLRYCLSIAKGSMCGHECPYFDECAGDIPHALIRDALELLEQDEPVMPDVQTRTSMSGKVIETYFCGKCGKEIYGAYQRCPYCGKRVKWG